MLNLFGELSDDELPTNMAPASLPAANGTIRSGGVLLERGDPGVPRLSPGNCLGVANTRFLVDVAHTYIDYLDLDYFDFFAENVAVEPDSPVVPHLGYNTYCAGGDAISEGLCAIKTAANERKVHPRTKSLVLSHHVTCESAPWKQNYCMNKPKSDPHLGELIQAEQYLKDCVLRTSIYSHCLCS